VTAGKVDIRGLSSIGREEFLDILGIIPGGDIDKELVRNGIKRAFLKGFFNDIIVRVPDGENPVVEVEVKERDFIGKINVKNNTGIGDKTIKELFLLKVDGAMRYDLLDAAVARLKESIASYGYPEAVIDVKVERTGKPYRVNIELKIEGGPPLAIRNINIVLPPSYGSETEGGGRMVLSELKLSPGDVFSRI
jgi:outer membrane protein assembly factor BamA